MKKIVILFIGFLLVSGNVMGQMTDDQVVEYVQQQSSKGVGQQKIVADLIKQGVTQQQFERLKGKYESKNNTSEMPSTEINRSRKSNGEIKRINDDYNHRSFTDKFVEWMTVVARK